MSTGPLRATGPLTLPGRSPALFANPAFMLLWLGQATSQVGDRVHQIAVMWWSLKLHGHLSDAGWVMVATTLPLVLFAPLGGALADRYERRALMLACDVARAVITGVLAALAFGQVLSLPVLLTGTALLGAFTAVFIPAAMSLIPDVVAERDLVKAGSLQELTIQLATIVGPSLGGLLVAAVGSPLAFAVNAGSFVVSAVALSLLRLPGRPAGTPALPAKRPSWWREMADGVLVARDIPAIGALLVAFGLTNFFSAPLLLFLPRYADLFGVGPRGLGFLEAALAIGTLGASFLLLWKPRQKPTPGMLPPACLGAIGLVMAGLGQWGTYPLLLGGLGIIGAALGAMNVTVIAYFQRTVPPDRLGRFMGLLTTVVFAAPSLGFGLLGALADTAHPGPYVAALGAGVMLVAAGLAVSLRRMGR